MNNSNNKSSIFHRRGHARTHAYAAKTGRNYHSSGGGSVGAHGKRKCVSSHLRTDSTASHPTHLLLVRWLVSIVPPSRQPAEQRGAGKRNTRRRAKKKKVSNVFGLCWLPVGALLLCLPAFEALLLEALFSVDGRQHALHEHSFSGREKKRRGGPSQRTRRWVSVRQRQ